MEDFRDDLYLINRQGIFFKQDGAPPHNNSNNNLFINHFLVQFVQIWKVNEFKRIK